MRLDQRQLLVELSASEPLLKKIAEKVIKEEFFDKAVERMKADFLAHPVTQEISEGVTASNISKTLDAKFSSSSPNSSPPNLYSFIGFSQAEGNPTEEILSRLDPSSKDGPKIQYIGKSSDKLTFQFKVSAPNEAAIYQATPLPWAEGISWAKRIEVGLAGVGKFLNVSDAKGSRSGGGVQIEKQIRPGRFRPVSYLSSIFKNFLADFKG